MRRLQEVIRRKQLRALVLRAALAVSASFTMGACADTEAVSDPEPQPLEVGHESKGRPLVPRGDFLVGRRSGRLVVLTKSGKPVRRVPRFKAGKGVQAIELAPDRRHAFVSVYVSDAPTRLYEVNLATGARLPVADAISPVLSPDKAQLAYVSTEQRVDIVYRTALVIRDLDTGQTKTIPLGPDVPEGTPPELVINWSPDGRRVAIFDDTRIRLVDVANARDVVSQPSVAGLAPVFLNVDSLVVLVNCCVGRQRVVRVDLRSGARSAFATLSSPPEGIRRLHRRLLMTVTALGELALVSRHRFRVIATGITAAAR